MQRAPADRFALSHREHRHAISDTVQHTTGRAVYAALWTSFHTPGDDDILTNGARSDRQRRKAYP